MNYPEIAVASNNGGTISFLSGDPCAILFDIKTETFEEAEALVKSESRLGSS